MRTWAPSVIAGLGWIACHAKGALDRRICGRPGATVDSVES